MSHTKKTDDQVIDALIEFVGTSSWEHARRIVERTPELLDPSVDFSLRRLIASTPEQARLFEEQRVILQRCREIGVAEAFDEIIQQQDALIPETCGASFQQAREAYRNHTRSKSLKSLDEAVLQINRLLSEPAFPTLREIFTVPAFRLGAKIYLGRFELTGNLKDLDLCIEHGEKALSLFTQGVPEEGDYLNLLSGALSLRYDRTGNRADLIAAIDLTERAVFLTPPESEDLPMHLINLATHLLDLYDDTKNHADLDKAVQYAQRAVSLTPNGAPNLLRRNHFLGRLFVRRFNEYHLLSDLDQAIEVAQRLTRLTPSQSPEQPELRSNLEKLKSIRAKVVAE